MNNANKLINLKKITEALLFVQNKPLKISNLAKLVNLIKSSIRQSLIKPFLPKRNKLKHNMQHIEEI